MITVKELFDLIINCDEIRIYIGGKTYLFNSENLPDEIGNEYVDSIDNPVYETERPLCINVDTTSFTTKEVENFMKEFSDYEI